MQFLRLLLILVCFRNINLHLLIFSTTVAIYDYDGQEVGDHKPFHFTDDDFKNLHTWRLYKGGRRDLDDRSVVAVGYTLGTYTTAKNNSRSLSTNVQFVILLGKTAVGAAE